MHGGANATVAIAKERGLPRAAGHLQRLREELTEEGRRAASPFEAEVCAAALSACPYTMVFVSCGMID